MGMHGDFRYVLLLVHLTLGLENDWSSTVLYVGSTYECPVVNYDFRQECTPLPNCTKENVALCKPAEMSSVYGDPEPSGPACVAVNGNTSSVYQPMFEGELNPNCIHTGLSDTNPWWLVRLGRNYTITEIVVYIRATQPHRMNRVIIAVDNQVCYAFPNGTASLPVDKTVSCSNPKTGSVLSLYRNASGEVDYFLNICEVQVWVCRPGLFGKDCNHECNCKNNETCDNYLGTCTAGCREGFYGNNCSQRCVNCGYPGTCNMSSGRCLAGCKSGWQEPSCNVCKTGYYGSDCENQCGYCKGGVMCNITDGKCPDGCDVTHVPPLCKELFSCREGNYGLNCSQKCGNCILGMSCNVFTGVCQDGCQDGFLPPLCSEKCPPGTWGRECKGTCGNCNGSACCHNNGSCEAGCVQGFVGDLCTVSLDQKGDSFENGAIIGAFVGSSLSVGISILAVIMIRRCRSRLVHDDTRHGSAEYRPQFADSASHENITTEKICNEENIYDEPENEKEENGSYAVLATEKQYDEEDKQDVQENTYEETTSVYQNIS